jgi:hypothetical protein
VGIKDPSGEVPLYGIFVRGLLFYWYVRGPGWFPPVYFTLPVREMAVKNGRKNEITSIKGVLLKWG